MGCEPSSEGGRFTLRSPISVDTCRCPKNGERLRFGPGSHGKRSMTGVVVVVHCRLKLADDGTDVGGTWRQMLPPSNAVKELDGIPNILMAMVVCA